LAQRAANTPEPKPAAVVAAPEIAADLKLESAELQSQNIGKERDYWKAQAAALQALLERAGIQSKIDANEKKMAAVCGDSATLGRDANNRPVCNLKPKP